MKRKVIQIADSTQLISLPRKWATEHTIHKGDELEIDIDDNKLVIYSDSKTSLKKRELTIGDEPPHIKYILHGLYKKGYDEVTLYFNNPETISVIQQIIHTEMIGFEVVEQSSRSCIIKAIAGGFEKEFDTMLRRSFLLLKTISEKVLEGVKNKDITTIASLLYIENDINKYTCFCRRIINKTSYMSYKTLMYCIVDELERIADEYKYMFNYFLKNGNNIKNINKKIIEMLQEVTNLLNQAYTTYYKFDINNIVKIFMKRKELITKSVAFKENVPGYKLLHYMINISQKIQDLMRFKLEIEL